MSAADLRAIAASLALLLLTACIPRVEAPRGGQRPPPETPERFRKCVAMMVAEGSKVEALPDRIFDNGCSATSAVKLVAIGIPVTNLGAVKCYLAAPFARWVGAKPGDIVEILRKSMTAGGTPYYRFCVASV